MRASQTTTAVSDQPVTLDRIMRQALAGELRRNYEVERQIPHALLVIMMQLNHHKPDAE
jgi:hypothetical protein